MNDYERELMSQGVFIIHVPEYKIPFFESDPMPPHHPVSPYAKFEKFHRKKKRK